MDNWGGARPGSGRPETEYTERITFKVTPLMKEWIMNEVKRQKKSQSEMLRNVLGKEMKRRSKCEKAIDQC